MKKQINITQDEIKNFQNFYRETVSEYLSMHHISIVYRGNQYGACYEISTHRNTYRDDKVISTKEQIFACIDINFPTQNLSLYPHEKEVYNILYSKADNTQRKVMQSDRFLINSLDDLSEALPKEYLYEFVKNSQHLYAEIFKNSNYLKSMADIWKAKLPQEQFEDLLVDFVSCHEKEYKKKTSKMAVEYLITSLWQDKPLYGNLRQIVPEPAKEDIFMDLKEKIYEIHIDRKALTGAIKLAGNSDYYDMHEALIELLNKDDVLKDLKLNSVINSTPSKVSKVISFIVRAPQDTYYDKPEMKKLFTSLYREYENLMMNENVKKWQIKDELNLIWLNQAVLNDTLPVTNSAPVKRNKI